MKRALLQSVLSAKANRRAVAIVTTLASGEQRLVEFENLSGDQLEAELRSAFRFDKSQTVQFEGAEYFIDTHNPPLKMMVIGAVHIAQSLFPLAQAVGHDVTVIDPRGAFATEARFPGVALYDDWPDEVLESFDLDARTAFIALTHDPKIDDPALSYALKSDVYYIGALGSRRTHANRLERLKELGFDEAQLIRIRGPIGLNIGAKGQSEIAIAIMAQVIQHLRLGEDAE